MKIIPLVALLILAGCRVSSADIQSYTEENNTAALEEILLQRVGHGIYDEITVEAAQGIAEIGQESGLRTLHRVAIGDFDRVVSGTNKPDTLDQYLIQLINRNGYPPDLRPALARYAISNHLREPTMEWTSNLRLALDKDSAGWSEYCMHLRGLVRGSLNTSPEQLREAVSILESYSRLRSGADVESAQRLATLLRERETERPTYEILAEGRTLEVEVDRMLEEIESDPDVIDVEDLVSLRFNVVGQNDNLLAGSPYQWLYPGARAYEIVRTGGDRYDSRAVLIATETRFASRGSAFLTVVQLADVDVVLRPDLGGFEVPWHVFREVPQDELREAQTRDDQLREMRRARFDLITATDSVRSNVADIDLQLQSELNEFCGTIN